MDEGMDGWMNGKKNELMKINVFSMIITIKKFLSHTPYGLNNYSK